MISAIFFVISLIIDAKRSFYRKGELVMDKKEIFIYFLKNRAIVTIISIVCTYCDPFNTKYMRIFFFLEMSNFLYIINEFKENYRLERMYLVVFTLFYLSIQLIFICHLAGCVKYNFLIIIIIIIFILFY